MPTIKPFDGYLIKTDRATSVVSPAYDSVSAEERRRFADENPENFINTMRLQEDYPEDSQPTQEQLLSDNKEQLQKLLHNGSFRPLDQSSMFVYQLGTGDHIQTGLVCEVSVEEYECGALRKHENTRASKEDLLARYQEVVGASSSPICLTYPQNTDIDTTIAQVITKPADVDFTTADGESQRVWAITDTAELVHLQQLFSNIEATYLTDGHHRAASGCRYAEIMRAKSGSNNGDEPFNQLLIALFPDNQLNLLPFHRCVRDRNGLSADQIEAALQQHFEVERLDSANECIPKRHGEFGMLVEDTWYRLAVRQECIDANDPVASLDVSILQDLILDPILGVRDMRDDPRLGYIAGVAGIDGIREAATNGWDVVFVCYATSIQQLMAVADANALMPPKSTYFDPKPRSGIFVRLK